MYLPNMGVGNGSPYQVRKIQAGKSDKSLIHNIQVGKKLIFYCPLEMHQLNLIPRPHPSQKKQALDLESRFQKYFSIHVDSI